MKLRMPDKYTITAILLIAASAVLVWIAIATNPGNDIAAALVISGLVCAITGIFALTFSGGEPIDPGLLGILPAQGCITFCRLANHLGIKGNAYFLPRRVTGELRVMQFNPTSTYKGSEGSPKGSFRETGPSGLVTTPSCDLLIQQLRKNNDLVIPYDKEDLTRLIRETIEDVFKFAPQVSARWSDTTVTITFHEYPAIIGCSLIAQESPQGCSMSPCPVCSLCGALIAEGLEKVVKLNKCSIAPGSRNVTAVFTILP